MNKAIFLDRDGTIIRHVDFLNKASQIRLLRGVARAIVSFKKLGFLVIIVTNQPVIARGLITMSQMDKLHQLIIRRLSAESAILDDIYFCPHHPNADLIEFRVKCSCRKPEIGMVLGAIKKYNIDIKKSFFVGDTTVDILTGINAGLRTILVKTGFGGSDKKFEVKPDFEVNNLKGVLKILRNEK